MKKDKKGIVTVIGGSGFIGSHVADQLTEEGYHVKIFDCKDSPWRKENQEMIVQIFLLEIIQFKNQYLTNVVIKLFLLGKLQKRLLKIHL